MICVIPDLQPWNAGHSFSRSKVQTADLKLKKDWSHFTHAIMFIYLLVSLPCNRENGIPATAAGHFMVTHQPNISLIILPDANYPSQTLQLMRILFDVVSKPIFLHFCCHAAISWSTNVHDMQCKMVNKVWREKKQNMFSCLWVEQLAWATFTTGNHILQRDIMQCCFRQALGLAPYYISELLSPLLSLSSVCSLDVSLLVFPKSKERKLAVTKLLELWLSPSTTVFLYL